MTTTENVGRWLILGSAFATAILSCVALAIGHDAAAEVASDTGYGIGVALGAGWPVGVLVVVAILAVVFIPSRAKHHEILDGRPTGVFVNGIELTEGEPNYPLIAKLERDLLAPRSPADWIREAEAEVGLAVASPEGVQRPRVVATRSVVWRVGPGVTVMRDRP